MECLWRLAVKRLNFLNLMSSRVVEHSKDFGSAAAPTFRRVSAVSSATETDEDVDESEPEVKPTKLFL